MTDQLWSVIHLVCVEGREHRVLEFADDYCKRPGSTGVEVTASNREQLIARNLADAVCPINHANRFPERSDYHVFFLIWLRYTDKNVAFLFLGEFSVYLQAGPLVEFLNGPIANVLASRRRHRVGSELFLDTSAIQGRRLLREDRRVGGICAVSQQQ